MIPIIILTTDFGSTDPFIDLTHHVAPGNIIAAALTIKAATPLLPP